MGSCPEHPLWQGLHGKAEFRTEYLLHSSPLAPVPYSQQTAPCSFNSFSAGGGGEGNLLPRLLWPTVKLCSASKDGLSERLMLQGPLLT